MSSNQPPRLSRRRVEALITVAIYGIYNALPDEDDQDQNEKATVKAALEAINILRERYEVAE